MNSLRTHLVRAKQKDINRRNGEVTLVTQLSQHVADVVARACAYDSGRGVWHNHTAKLHRSSGLHRLGLSQEARVIIQASSHGKI